MPHILHLRTASWPPPTAQASYFFRASRELWREDLRHGTLAPGRLDGPEFFANESSFPNGLQGVYAPPEAGQNQHCF